MVFNIPKEVDEFLTLGFLMLFVIAYMVNLSTAGQLEIQFVRNEFGIEIVNQSYEIDYFSNPQQYMLNKFAENGFAKSERAWWVAMLIYWLGIPLLCYYFAIFRFKKGMWGDHNFQWKRELASIRDNVIKFNVKP